MDAKYLAEIKALTADAESELATLGTPLTAPAISVDVFNDISPKTDPKLRKLVSLANVYIPALIAEVERLNIILQDERKEHAEEYARLRSIYLDAAAAKDQQIATLKKALTRACEDITKHTCECPASLYGAEMCENCNDDDCDSNRTDRWCGAVGEWNKEKEEIE